MRSLAAASRLLARAWGLSAQLALSVSALALPAPLWTSAALAREATQASPEPQGADLASLIEAYILSEAPEELPQGSRIEIYLPEDAPRRAAHLEVVEYDLRQGRFATMIRTTQGESLTLRGRLAALIDVPVPNRAIMPGETAKPEDFSYKPLPALNMSRYTVTDLAEISGQEVRRVLAQGRAVPQQSLQAHRVVKRGEKLSLSFTQGGLELSAPARALEDGALDQVVRVQNLNSNKTLMAIVVGQGRVEVQP